MKTGTVLRSVIMFDAEMRRGGWRREGWLCPGAIVAIEATEIRGGIRAIGPPHISA